MDDTKNNMLDKPKETQELALVAGYGTAGGFELMQRQARALAASQLIPKNFQGQIPDCIIALEMASRIGASPFAVLQNLYIVHGKPAWSAQFLVSCINACGRFSPLRYKQTGKKGTDTWGCVAWAKDLNDGEVLESPEVTIGMAKAEGWVSKAGSKWKTLPELMLRYRAATFFARTYAPDVTMGMVTNDEAHEIAARDVEVSDSPAKEHAADTDLEEPSIPPSSDVGEEKKKSEPAKKKKGEAAKKPAAAGRGLPPVDELGKPACLAEMGLHAEKPYYAEVLARHISGDFAPKDCPASTLRDVVADLRAEADKET